MTVQVSQPSKAKVGVSIVCFLLILAGQGYLLRSLILDGQFSLLSAPFLAEGFFCIVLLAGCIVCLRKPSGWTNLAGCICAFLLFGLYAACNILYYPVFSAAYLTGVHTEYNSVGGALVALKLVLALIGVTAGIPASPPIDKFEYSRRLREKAELQQAQWAKASVRGAKKDLDDTIAKLRQNLSEEELSELLNKLQEASGTPPSAREEDDASHEGIAEQWRGWGGGM